MNLSERLSNTNGWIYLLIMAIMVLLFYLVVKSVIDYTKASSKIKKQGAVKKMVFVSIVFIVSIFFFFLNFGAGKPHKPTPVESTGEYKQIQEIGDEMTKEELVIDVKERTTDELEIQSDDSLRSEYLKKSEEKSNEIIEKYLND